MDQSTMLLIGGVGQVAVLVLLAFTGLMLKNKVQEAKEQIMAQVRAEFVPASISAQQQSHTHLLLRNLSVGVGELKKEAASTNRRLDRLEFKIDKGSHDHEE